jgi:lipopolysaccharide biosynthesis regulator YciM
MGLYFYTDIPQVAVKREELKCYLWNQGSVREPIDQRFFYECQKCGHSQEGSFLMCPKCRTFQRKGENN